MSYVSTPVRSCQDIHLYISSPFYKGFSCVFLLQKTPLCLFYRKLHCLSLCTENCIVCSFYKAFHCVSLLQRAPLCLPSAKDSIVCPFHRTLHCVSNLTIYKGFHGVHSTKDSIVFPFYRQLIQYDSYSKYVQLLNMQISFEIMQRRIQNT